MPLSASRGPWTFTPIKIEPGSSRQECGVSRGHRAQRMQPERSAADALRVRVPDGCCAQRLSAVGLERARAPAVVKQADRGQFWGKSVIMACRVSTKAGLDR